MTWPLASWRPFALARAMDALRMRARSITEVAGEALVAMQYLRGQRMGRRVLHGEALELRSY